MFEIISKKIKNDFKLESVTFLKDFIDKNLCQEAVQWLEINERKLVEKFRNDKRGLVSELYDGRECIKYFEYPLYANPKIFTRFMNSKVFLCASELLEKDVIFQSLEIHSRFPGSELIPMHQDNAYYGLNNGKALTFYIPINSQSYKFGGLRYLSIDQKSPISDHIASSSSGFSLEIKNKVDLLRSHKEKLFNFKPGDCSVHYSNSIHFADEVPFNAKRCWVVRFSFFSTDSIIKEGHKEWYQKIIEDNRIFNSKNK